MRIDCSREETFVSNRVRHSIRFHIITWLHKDGSIAARKVECFSNQGGYASRYQRVRMAISSGDLNLAEELLNAQTNHDAEWNFLKGAICYRRGWLDEARRYYQTAVTMAPDNPEYQRALDILEGRGAAYRPDGYGNVTTGTCGNSDCLRLCGATLCCNALGVPVCFC